MKDFFVAYWKELAEGLIAIITLLVVLLKKRGKSNPALEKLYFQLPTIISHFESVYGSGHGEVKKSAVIEACDKLFFKLSGIHLKESEYYFDLVDKQIEKILSTPSRKEKDEK